MNSGIYKIENTVTGDFYIGSSEDIDGRKYSHLVRLKAGKHHNHNLQRAWDKDGPEVFRFTTIENCLPNALLLLEQKYLDTLNPAYNVNETAERPNRMTIYDKKPWLYEMDQEEFAREFEHDIHY